METRSVVLLHGLSGSARWWRATEATLASDFDVHVLELPGFGGARRRRFDLEHAPEFVTGRLDELGLERTHLVGHSLGGLVAARVAARAPERVDRLVLVSPAGALERRRLHSHALPLASALRHARPRLLQLVAADALRAGPVTLFRAARQLLGDDVVPQLASITAPTLLVWGERDPLVPPSLGEVFRREIPSARLELVAGARHVPMLERPGEFGALVHAFLAE